MQREREAIDVGALTNMAAGEKKALSPELPTLASKKEEHCRAYRTNKFQAQWGVIANRNEGRLDNFQNLDCNCCNPCNSVNTICSFI